MSVDLISEIEEIRHIGNMKDVARRIGFSGYSKFTLKTIEELRTVLIAHAKSHPSVTTPRGIVTPSKSPITEIKFFSSKNKNFEFSNFFPVEIEVDGKKYTSSEHFFQSSKFIYDKAGEEEIKRAEYIRTQPTAILAYKAGKTKTGAKINPNWLIDRDDVMRKIVKIKFTTIPDLREKLLKTRKARLIEASPYDSYWGNKMVGGVPGKNMLGKILEEVRDLIQKEERE